MVLQNLQEKTFSSVLKRLTAVSKSLANFQNNISAIEKIIDTMKQAE